MNFARRLKDLRTEKNLSQCKLAKETGISQPTIGRWEAGLYEPSASDIIKLAKYFEVSTDYILGLDDY